MNACRFGPTARVLAGLLGATLLVALTAAAVPGVAPELRHWFAFAPGPRPAGIACALAVWAANLRVLGFLLLAALAARERRLRPALDAVVTLVVGANVGLAGGALGAYGPGLLPSLAHVPLEWAGLAGGLTAYLHARTQRVLPARLARLGAGAAALLALGASVEVWLSSVAVP